MGTLRNHIYRLSAKRSSVLPTILLTLILVLPSLVSAAQQVGEYQIKAVFLCNLAHFVTWPSKTEEDKDEFIIGIYGPDPFGSLIDKTVIGEMKNDRPIRIVRYTDLEQIDPSTCNILFIHSSKLSEWENIRQHLSGYPVLTVSDITGFPENGGMVNLLKTGQKIEVEINHSAVMNSGLSMSSKLLSLARIVQ